MTGFLERRAPGRGSSLREFCIYPALVGKVFPLVRRELQRWRSIAGKIPSPELRKEALSSIDSKAFHCMGGGVLSLFNPKRLNDLIRVIVAVQTISDYLDNLCDRLLQSDNLALSRESLLHLHKAMLCALDEDALQEDFYRFYRGYIDCDDGGYLSQLVDASRSILFGFPDYPMVKEKVLRLARLYSELQARKHLAKSDREESLKLWFQEERADIQWDDITWWEFGAASGSTLGIFSLVAFSSVNNSCLPCEVRASGIEKLYHLYFPGIAGLHILLDYLIDRGEDRLHGDLNFVEYYQDERACLTGLKKFLERSMRQIDALDTFDPNDIGDSPGMFRGFSLKPLFHRAVVRGLLAMYLSDPKAGTEECREISFELMTCSGYPTFLLKEACAGIRRCLKF